MYVICCLLSPVGNIAGALYHKLKTQCSAPVDGRNYRPKHVELVVIINKICYCCIYLAVYIIVSVMHGHTNIKFLCMHFSGFRPLPACFFFTAFPTTLFFFCSCVFILLFVFNLCLCAGLTVGPCSVKHVG
jgi:hypothetical protein